MTREPFGSATSEFARSAGAVGISHGAAAASAQGVDGAASASATASSTAGDAIAFALILRDAQQVDGAVNGIDGVVDRLDRAVEGDLARAEAGGLQASWVSRSSEHFLIRP